MSLKRRIAGVASLALMGATLSSEALAVKTKDCPEFISVSFSDVQTSLSQIEENDKDMDTIEAALSLIHGVDLRNDTMRFADKEPGVCLYTSVDPNLETNLKVYTRDGKDLMYYEIPLRIAPYPGSNKYISLRIFATIESLNPFQVKSQKRNGAMIYFAGNPAPFYDGRAELRPIGFAENVIVTPEP